MKNDVFEPVELTVAEKDEALTKALSVLAKNLTMKEFVFIAQQIVYEKESKTLTKYKERERK
jgi:hypothetical protein